MSEMQPSTSVAEAEWKERIRITSERIRPSPPDRISYSDYLSLERDLKDLYQEKSVSYYWLKTAVERLEEAENLKLNEYRRKGIFVAETFPQFEKASYSNVKRGTRLYILDGKQMRIARVCEQPREVSDWGNPYDGPTFTSCYDTDKKRISLDWNDDLDHDLVYYIDSSI